MLLVDYAGFGGEMIERELWILMVVLPRFLAFVPLNESKGFLMAGSKLKVRVVHLIPFYCPSI